jgi:hypothetical protein
MKRLLIGAVALALVGIPARSQSLEDLNIQIHGYATQGFLYTSQNNIFTTSSNNGSPAWDEAVVNVSAQPIPKLRVGVQGRYFLLGNLGNAIILDWAAADYKANDYFGIRFGKVKTPSGLWNELQDIDPSYQWALLPQSVYPLMSRNSLLAHYGGVAYGTFKLGAKGGKLEYRGWGGERTLAGNDGYFLTQTEGGLILPNGVAGVTTGAALRWKTPLPGLLIGASDTRDNQWQASLIQTATAQGVSLQFPGTETINKFNLPNFFAKYEKDKWMVAAEYARLPVTFTIVIPTADVDETGHVNQESWYGMVTYKVTGKLTAGVYDTQSFDHQAALGPARYLKDWAISGRYDFGQYVYAKAEEHIYDGTFIGYDLTLNPNGLQPNSKLTILKIGVSF